MKKNKKMFRVFYLTEGKGYVDVEANTEEEAKDKFFYNDVIGEYVEESTSNDFDYAEDMDEVPF